MIFLSTENTSENKVNAGKAPEKKEKEPMFTGKKIATSLLAGFTVPFVYIICSTLSVYFTNASQFRFGVWDFLPTLIWISLAMFAVISAVLVFTKGVIRDTAYALISGFVGAAMVQNFISNLTFKGLPGDGNVAVTPEWVNVVNILVWSLVLVAAVWFAVISKYKKAASFVLTYVLVLVLIMQLASVIPSYLSFLSQDKSNNEDTTAVTTVLDENGNAIPEEELMNPYLSTNNIFEVSEKENVIVFILDRFDVRYYNELVNKSPEIKEKLDGFTCYSDNLALYPRTYPAVTSMVTGVNQDFSMSRTEYLDTAFTESTFLKDLKNNNYKVNLYVSEFYSYNNVEDLEGIVDNFYRPTAADEIQIPSKFELAKTMFKTGAYFWAPEIFKPNDVSTRTINENVVRAGEYVLDDVGLYEKFTESGLYTQDDKGTFTFLHMRGCHSPFTMNENCEEVEPDSVGSFAQTTGCFKFIFEYIDELKSLGLYEDATIIITGDHAALNSDHDLYTDENLTALLVKESGKSSTPLVTSDVPVSQDNFLATIVKSAGIDTDTDYGKAYSEETNDPSKVRHHFFQTAPYATSKNYGYEVKGDGRDFANWEIKTEEEIGSLY